VTPVVERITAWTAAAVLALGVPTALAAQDSTPYKNHLYDKFQGTLDFTTVINSSNARVDGNGGQGTTLDFKSVLGVPGTTVQPALGFKWKPGRHTELDLGYQFINQSGQRTFTDTVVIGSDTLSGNVDLSSKLGSNNATVQIKYSIWAAERHSIGLAVGFGAIFFRADFTGSASGCVATSCDSTGAFSISKSVTVPTASLGAFGRWRLGDRWYVGGDARGFGGRVDRYDISVFEGDAAAQYFLSTNWGLALGWYYTNVTVNISPRSGASVFSGKVAYDYSSLRLGAVYAF